MNAPTLLDASLRPMFEDLLYREARYLDNRRFDEWLAMLHAEIRYWAPVRTDLEREEEDFDLPHLMCHYDDDYEALVMRARRVQMGLGYTDQPAPRTRRLITNVLVTEARPGVAAVTSNFLAFRSHTSLPDHYFTGCRNDQWVDEDGWKLKSRQIIIDKSLIEGMAMLF
jgi:3-phenylpropionate/cinnamic acid dioxygenase small subunit